MQRNRQEHQVTSSSQHTRYNGATTNAPNMPIPAISEDT